MTNRSGRARGTNLTRTAFFAAPLCMLAYGLVRLSDPDHGPGAAWTAGHLALTASVLLFGAVFLGLYRMATVAAGGGPGGGRLSAAAATATGLAGVLAVTAQAVIDLVVGFRATDRAGMDQLFEQIQSQPGVQPAVYTVGPLLFYVGLLWLTVQLAAQRRIGAWRPALVLLGTAAPAVSLDLIPLGALLFAAALTPLARALPAPGTAWAA
ncbi:hypothetical protein OOK31_32495 [Streptomyces sp. NBC_00249]|uniref:hypothetical protein n=1 Tax=Streptomyces sp. NBC_00249 TaxID=2975690 RepID=UPI002251C8AD|nr:hypothetical protein [Streptomyces sp. NBC_00249]MCX5198553.1 hypothetical protein [Streptomyces sp. NBC_00249]